MATRSDYRTALASKLAGIEESGYADFGFTDAESNLYLEMSVAKLFPTFYKRTGIPALTPASYGTMGYASVSVAGQTERVFMVEDATELTALTGWQPRPTMLVGLDDSVTSVNVYLVEPYAMPDDDVTAVEWSAEFKPLVVLGALIEALESRQDRGVRPDPERGAGTDALSRLESSFERLKMDLGMNLPSVKA